MAELDTDSRAEDDDDDGTGGDVDAGASSESDDDADEAAPTAEDPSATTPDEPEPDMVTFGGGSVEVSVDSEPAPEPDDTETEEPAEDPLMACDGVAGTGEGVLIDDMEDGDLQTLAQDNREAGWFTYDDATGGTHDLLMDEITDGAPGSTRAVHVTGGGFSEWGAGFGVGLLWEDESGRRCVFDASFYTGLRFWVRGNDVSLRVFATNPSIIPLANGGTCGEADTCWDNHGYDLIAEDAWTEVFVSFDALNQRWTEASVDFDSASIFTVEFSLEAGVDYEVWLDDLGFYREGEDLPAYADP